MKKIIKWGLIVFVVLPFTLLLIIGTIAKMMGVKTTPKEQVVMSTTAPTVAISPVKEIKYETLQKWDINNGGYGKTILIPVGYLNEDDMVALGKKLNVDTKNDKNAFISVYIDRKAADLRDKLASGLTKAEEAVYDKNFVGQYTKNGNSGLHTFVIYFDGVSGKDSKTIKY